MSTAKRFFHHDVDAVACAILDYFPVVKSIGVNKNCLGPSLLQHLFKVRK